MSQIKTSVTTHHIAAYFVMSFLATSASADDWPQWRGQDRLGVWHETGIVDTLPEQLKVRILDFWTRKLVVGPYTDPLFLKQSQLA